MRNSKRELPDRHRQIISLAAASGYSASYSMMTQRWRLRDPADCPVLREGASGFTADEIFRLFANPKVDK